MCFGLAHEARFRLHSCSRWQIHTCSMSQVGTITLLFALLLFRVALHHLGIWVLEISAKVLAQNCERTVRYCPYTTQPKRACRLKIRISVRRAFHKVVGEHSRQILYKSSLGSFQRLPGIGNPRSVKKP